MSVLYDTPYFLPILDKVSPDFTVYVEVDVEEFFLLVLELDEELFFTFNFCPTLILVDFK
ncbi:hypothetical protein [Rummeliibacillus suwonensis]|uniref:hypothetical protein n=1 Tax=Rummeliibacillus suwonensis TaxID=1306154 RepID=UPI003133076F